MSGETMGPRRGRRIRAAVFLLFALLAGAAAWWYARHSEPGPDAAASATTYTCPMHPQIVRDEPGDCPICGMALVPRKAATSGPLSASPQAEGERRVLFYRHPMNPSVRSDRPAKDEMGMDYVPVYAEAATGATQVAGRAMVEVPAERGALLGIRSEEVKVSGAGGALRTVGRVAVDESQRHHVHAKFPGYVEHLFVEAVGDPVRRGQAIVSLFSPEMVAAQAEYLVALRARGSLSGSDVPGVARGANDLVGAALQRLRFFDVGPAQITELERTGKARRTVTLTADRGGYVTEKNAFHGMRVTPGERLLEITDLSRVWILADVYERDLAAVRPGQPARVTLPSAPGREWTGRITLVSPTVDAKTRAAQARVEVANPGGVLRPEMFADVFLETPMGMAAVVPETAVIRTGERTLVFVDHGSGRYEPREVTLGSRVLGGYQVLSGVAAGERVVVSANFLLDSESSLRAAIAAAEAGARPSR